MAIQRILNSGGINTFLNPLVKSDQDLIRAVNVESYPYGAKRKRSGYTTYLGTADGSAVTGLFSWTKNDGSLFVYRTSGTKIYSSVEGTGAWTVTGNGTISAGGKVGYAVLDNTLILGDGVGSTRHTTDGTSFTNTTLAPPAQYFTQYQNRIFAGGTSSTLFYSTTGNAADWSTAGTSDSSSLTIPGEGKINSVFTANDRVVSSKASGKLFRYDGYSLLDMSSLQGPQSPYSVSQVEGYFFWLSRLGIQGYGGGRPEVLSNPIQAQIYNDAGSGIAGTTFQNAPGVVHRYDYLLSVGNVTDDVIDATVSNCVIKYDFQKNEFLNWSFYNKPTAFHSFKDTSGNQTLIFGDSTGQVYKLNGTITTDNSNPVESILELVIHLGQPDVAKKWNEWFGFFNPGCEATVQIAVSDTFTRSNLNWKTLGDASDGIMKYRFPSDTRGKLLHLRITDNSKDSRFTYYGSALDVIKAGDV